MKSTPIDIGNRLELFVDRLMANSLQGDATLRMHCPVRREIVLRTDRPWEGNACGYISFFRDGDRIRMYYKACDFKIATGNSTGEDGLQWSHPYYVAYAESPDGVHFERPDLGLVAYQNWMGIPVHDPLANNIILPLPMPEKFPIHGFTAFRDCNPAAPMHERYKAVGAIGSADPKTSQLFALTSPDGLRWNLRPDPIVRGLPFDSQNLAFRDEYHGCYRAYMRSWHPEWRRYISTATSDDFVTWTEPEFLELPGATPHQLYTNQIMPYPRAPHLFVGFPTRYVEREWSRGMELLPDVDQRRLRHDIKPRFGTAITEGLLMAGRDGRTFHMWDEAFLRPGPQTTRSWAYGDNYQAWGLIETPAALEDAPRELSFYAVESYFLDEDAVFRRYSLRMDGFVSVNAPLAGGTVATPPLVFNGNQLLLNIETSAAGSARVQLEEPGGAAIQGFTFDDCHEIFGDRIEYPVAWRATDGCGRLAGKPVQLRIQLRDADLYAFRFA